MVAINPSAFISFIMSRQFWRSSGGKPSHNTRCDWSHRSLAARLETAVLWSIIFRIGSLSRSLKTGMGGLSGNPPTLFQPCPDGILDLSLTLRFCGCITYSFRWTSSYACRDGAVARPLGRAFNPKVIRALPNGRATAPDHYMSMPSDIPPCLSSSCSSEMRASVVSIKPAIDAAFCNAQRVTFAGSIIPAATRSSKVSVAAL